MKLFISAVVLAALISTGMASAASLGGVNAGDLGAGNAAVPSCDTSFTHSFTTSNGVVTAVTVSGIAGACVGGELSLTLTNSSGSAIGSGGAVTVTGASHVLSVSPQPSAPSVAGIHIVVVGP